LIAIGGGFICAKEKNGDTSIDDLQSSLGIIWRNFTIHLLQGFFPEAILLLEGFDTGNAWCFLGGLYVSRTKITGQNRGTKEGQRKLFSQFRSPTFTTLYIMILLSIKRYYSRKMFLLSLNTIWLVVTLFVHVYDRPLFRVTISRSDLKKVSTASFRVTL